jgi:hypothetical protein
MTDSLGVPVALGSDFNPNAVIFVFNIILTRIALHVDAVCNEFGVRFDAHDVE